MNEDVLKVMTLQGNMRVKLLQAGLSQKDAETLSGDFSQDFMDSGLLTKEALEAVKEFAS
jgi:hypothetical protein